MNRDSIREMLADIEGAVTKDFASLPRHRNDNGGTRPLTRTSKT
jgi:hypothetical protein